MKKIISLLTVFSVITATVFSSGCTKKAEEKNELTKVRLNEVVHSVFYAPQYVAIEKGFFEDEGLEIELSVGQGADKSMTALLSGSADIALITKVQKIMPFHSPSLHKEQETFLFQETTSRTLTGTV